MQEFIRKNGVTPCPAAGTKELAEFNIARERAKAEGDSWMFGGWRRKRKSKKAAA